MDLLDFAILRDLKQSIISDLEKDVKIAHKQCIQANRLLSIGDRVEFLKDNRVYEIIDEPVFVESYASTKESKIYDLSYTGLEVKKDGKTYRKSLSNNHKREIFQRYLTTLVCVLTE